MHSKPTDSVLPYLRPTEQLASGPSSARADGERPQTSAHDSMIRRSRHDLSGAESWVSVAGYEILGELGHGSMGVVYKARQKNLNRLVALKTIRAGAYGKEGLSRFISEARVVAQLQHPNIIQIYEISLQQDLPFFSMELVEGGNLADHLAGRPQPSREAAQLTLLLARAIHAAHEKGIVHRDLKPANILLAQKGQGSNQKTLTGQETWLTTDGSTLGHFEPKVSDFGLAKQLQDDSSQTQSGMIMGTPSYMAPEQAEGRSRDVGPAADIYALGAILYEMLTGRPPYNAESPAATVLLLFQTEPVAPSQLMPRVSRDLETICMKCLQKDPRRRYESAQALADDLKRFLDGEPIHARPTPVLEQTWKWLRRHPATAAVLVSVLCALLGFFGVTLWHQTDLQFRLTEARREEQHARDAEEEARRRANLTRLQAEVGELLQRAEAALVREDWGAAVVPLTTAHDRLRGDDPDLSDLRDRLDDLSRRANQQRGDRERFQRFLDLHNETLVNATLFTGSDLASALEQTRQAACAALAVQGIRPGTESLPALDSPYLSQSEKRQLLTGCYELLLLLAEATAQPLPGQSIATQQRQAREALRLLDHAARLGVTTRAYHQRRGHYLLQGGAVQAASAEQRLAQTVRPAGALDHFLLGAEELRRGSPTVAIRTFDRVLQEQPGHFWARYYQALAWLKQHRPDLAAAGFTACLGQRNDLAWPYLLRGVARGELRLYSEAEADFAAATRCRLDGSALYAWLVNRAVLRLRQSRLREAEADLIQAIGLCPRHYQGHVNLAQVYLRDHRLDDAIRQLDRAIASEGRLPSLYRTRAHVHLVRKDERAALADLDRAIELGARGPAIPLAGDYLERARLLLRQRQHQAALLACAEALQRHPEARAYRLRAEILLGMKRYLEALAALDTCVEKKPGDVEVLCARAAVRSRLGQYQGAQADYGRALDLEPSAEIYAARGWTYLVSEAHRLALADFDEALEREPGASAALAGRGLAHALLGQARLAIADARAALQAGPESSRLFFNVARIYAQVTVRSPQTTSRRMPDLDRADCARRGIELLASAVECTAAEERAAFWNEYILGDPLLRPLRQAPAFQPLAARYARQVTSQGTAAATPRSAE